MEGEVQRGHPPEASALRMGRSFVCGLAAITHPWITNSGEAAKRDRLARGLQASRWILPRIGRRTLPICTRRLPTVSMAA
jgi:hypothetical protein